MNALTDLAPTIAWVCAGLAALSSLFSLPATRRPLRLLAGLLLLLGAIALVLSLALPGLLPARSALVRPDGSTDDPRLPAALALAGAALLALLPAWRSLRPGRTATLGLLLPGLVAAGAVVAVASFAHLHQPLALAGIALAALAGVTALVLTFRARGHAPVALQAFATALLALAGTLSLHGARLGAVALAEGAAIDTLGQRLYFAGAEPVAADRRVLRVVLYGVRDSLALRPELRGLPGQPARSIADARVFAGPIVVPIALEEHRARPHDVQWADRATPLQAGGATIRLSGFRFEKGDTIRLYADLDVTTPAGTQRVSPGVYATSRGEIPFAADARGLGPIAVAGFDADHGRVGLVLPQLSESNVSRVAQLDLRLRPALPLAWAGALLALLAFLASVAVRPEAGTRR